jgi:hypothetical protein
MSVPPAAEIAPSRAKGAAVKSARWLALVAVCLAAPANVARPADPKDDLHVLYHQISALNTLHEFRATPAQLDALGKFAKTTAAKPGKHKAVKVSDELRKTMTDLHAALLDGDPDKIDELYETFQDLLEKEKVEFDEVAITPAARKATADFLKKLSPRQVAGFIAANAEEFPEPQEKIVKAFDEVRKLPAKKWEAERDDVADEIGWLVGGLDTAAEKKVKGQVVSLLNKVRALSDADFKEKRGDLEKEAKGVAGEVGPTEVVRHYVEHAAAELLSNPQLPAALEAKMKNGR